MSRHTQVPSSSPAGCPYGAFTLHGRPFQAVPVPSGYIMVGPTTPTPPRRPRFGLFPFRSPLLRESMFLSPPAGTEMFQFPAFAPDSQSGDGPSARRVPPFGHARIASCLRIPAPFRSLPRPSSPPEAKASPVRPCNLLSVLSEFTRALALKLHPAISFYIADSFLASLLLLYLVIFPNIVNDLVLSGVSEALSSTLSSEMGCKDTDFFFTSKSFLKNI